MRYLLILTMVFITGCTEKPKKDMITQAYDLGYEKGYKIGMLIGETKCVDKQLEWLKSIKKKSKK